MWTVIPMSEQSAGSTGRKECPECGDGSILFDPQVYPKPDRFVCPNCDHEWREDRSVDTGTDRTETNSAPDRSED